jgi:probable rRNA maturation factor
MSNFAIDVQDYLSDLPAEWVPILEETCQLVLIRAQAPVGSGVSIVLSDNAQLQVLNRDFLGIDAPTDVLSFPNSSVYPPSGPAPYLGDIIISVEKAEAQALAAGHTLTAELQLLVVHGTLHLLGHDHAEPIEKARMWAAQADALTALAVSVHIPE